jgi:hypothetical protein
MELFIMQFYPASCHFIPHRYKTVPQHPGLKTILIYVLPFEEINYNFVYFDL